MMLHREWKTTVARTALLSAVAFAVQAQARDYYVESSNSIASDGNPGTREKPFKTLSHAGNAARPGDHVFIRGGLYRETLTIKSPNDYPAEDKTGFGKVVGRHNQRGTGWNSDRIVFEAYENEAVTIAGSELLPPALFEPVAGKKDLYAVSLQDALKEKLRTEGVAFDRFVPSHVFWNGHSIPAHQVRNEQGLWTPAIPGADDAPAWHYDETTHTLYLHLGGRDPRLEGQVEVPVRASGIVASSTRCAVVGKLTVQQTRGPGITISSSERIIIQDCHVKDSGGGIRGAYTENATVRRNSVQNVDGRGIDMHGAYGAVLYDNMVANSRRYAFTVHSGEYCRFYHNIAIKSAIEPGWGYWTDCPGVGHIWMGNAAVRLNFYIESPAENNLVQWNTVWRYRHQGIYLRANLSNLVRENLVAFCGTGLVMGSTDTPRHNVEGNVFIQNWLKQNRLGISTGQEPNHPGEQTVNFAQANVYENLPGGAPANWAGRRYDTLEELQEAAGQESLGREAEIDYGDLGLVWVRADVPGEGHEPFPMFGNPTFDRQGTQTRIEPFFWRRGDAEGADHFPEEWSSAQEQDLFPGFADDMGRGSQKEQRGSSRLPNIPPVKGTPIERYVWHFTAMTDPPLDERGVGVWSPSLPTVGGATIDLAVWMKPIAVEPTADGGGAVVYVEWSDWTGQNKSRSYLVGGEPGADLMNARSNRGSTDWSRVSGPVTAPPEARRFSLYLGLRSASGQVLYGAVEEIRTLPGEEPVIAIPEEGKKDMPLIDPAQLTFQTLDLSGVANRGLSDEVADDGKGGWADQGAAADMRDLETGLKEVKGVPFQLLAPKSCVVLRSRRRPQSPDLPEQVAMAVGAKLDTLYFLHSGAWIKDGRKHWTYDIVYADGRTEEIPVIGGVGVRDWTLAGERYDFPNTAKRRASVWPQTVANIISPTCGLYVMEWLNPYPATPVKEIRMMTGSAEKGQSGVPILMAITLGAKK